MESPSHPPRVILWTAPRCVSTAFERSIMELSGGKTLHEPYSFPYYFGTDRQSKRYPAADCDPTASYETMTRSLLETAANSSQYSFVFAKDMAYYVDHIIDELLEGELGSTFTHTFLIRQPAFAISSFYNASIAKELTGWTYFDPIEAGFKQLYSLYRAVERRGHPIIIVDASDLLVDPDGIMESYCTATGLPYRASMTTWRPGPVAELSTWNGWHEDVLTSSGFVRRNSAQQRKKAGIGSGANACASLPTEVAQLIADAQPLFAEMHTKRLRAASSAAKKLDLYSPQFG